MVAQKYIELLPVIKFWGEGEREGGQEQEVKYIAFVVSECSFLFINKPQQCCGTLGERLAFNCEVASGIGHVILMGRQREENITELQNMAVNLFQNGVVGEVYKVASIFSLENNRKHMGDLRLIYKCRIVIGI